MDLFRLLGGGAQFNKKRFGSDIELFEGSAKNSKADKNAAVNDPKLRSKLLSEIDLFNSAPSSSNNDTLNDEESDQEEDVSSDDDDLNDNEEGVSRSIITREDAVRLRKKLRIKCTGTDVPHPFATFTDLSKSPYDLLPALYENLKKSEYTKPTAIQMQAIPIIMKGRDMLGCAPTGSGKTLAFCLPIVHDLKKHENVGCRAVILAPTRELAQQIQHVLSTLSAGTDLRVQSLTKMTDADKSQAPSQRKKYDILVTTPLRLVWAIKENEVDLSSVRHLVLDEADRLLEHGFLEQTDEIFAACPTNTIHRSMFSATLSSTVEDLARTVLKNPIRVTIGLKNTATHTIKQQLLFTGSEEGKRVAIRDFIQKGIKPPVLIFVQSIDRAKALFHELVFDGINVEVIHSERSKAQRDNVIDSFRQGRIWVLIATDLMARGLDFKGVNLVINYDFPQSNASYIHRIGRTGRAGRAGEAITYFNHEDMPYLKSVVNIMRESGCEVPEWMLKLKRPK
ncbi:P-loop containing nucleoside triphosphate hydrolase protein [Syncephalastrum racemosum]|uniref:RNA helicase n=1 Tax=Syncephalastrum racemosum TaxID=13706 RepID=A0A1X2HJ67_SYNRA|nr:P-loop containing nucleoside triphosphate hydrolase protein [Syncephalastrum racemosum]